MDKRKKYIDIISQANSYLNGYKIDEVGKMSIICSLIKTSFPEFIFCGFYRVIKNELLEIGPYQGDIIPCGHINFNRGVCGKSARERRTIIVEDVKKFSGYISCDNLTVSEIVVPIIKNEKLIAVLDIDGAEKSQFDEIDQKNLERILRLI